MHVVTGFGLVSGGWVPQDHRIPADVQLVGEVAGAAMELTQLCGAHRQLRNLRTQKKQQAFRFEAVLALMQSLEAKKGEPRDVTLCTTEVFKALVDEEQ